MNDDQISASIEDLVAEEHRLLAQGEQGGLTPPERRRLEEVRVELDRCWDFLRQRRAREEFGQDPDRVGPRDESTVEDYLQ